ncbi:MAG: hypothetical protein AB7U25_26105 [Vicinamibacterales bacterium]
MAIGRRNIKNNWATTLQADAAAAATTLTLPQPWIDLLTAPNPSATEWYELTLDDGVQAPEIVRCTGKGTGTVTVVRQQQGTVAPTTWGAGTKCEIRITAELARVLEGSHWIGASGSLVIGPGAGAALDTGYSDVFIGPGAGAGVTTGAQNVAVGLDALSGADVVDSTVAIGVQALQDATAGSLANTAVGFQAGTGAGAATSSTYLGAETGAATPNLAAAIAIGRGARAEASNTVMIGSLTSPISGVYICAGTGPFSSARDLSIQPAGAIGNDKPGSALRLAAGQSTGAASSGSVIIATVPAGASGSARNEPVDRAEWNDAGLFWTYAGLKTGDPGNGAGTWKLGTVQAGAVALDTANYVEVDIGGTVVKLLKAA